jgi:hypothetical protein
MIHSRPYDIGLVVNILTVLLSGMALLDDRLLCLHASERTMQLLTCICSAR